MKIGINTANLRTYFCRLIETTKLYRDPNLVSAIDVENSRPK